MLPGSVVVLDVGKTLAKLSLWARNGKLIEQRHRYNDRIQCGGRLWLDAAGIERWTQEVLTEFARLGSIAAIVPVGHGAAAAIISKDRLLCPVPDYEDPIAPALRAAYEEQRDAFARTGSPALPDGLNLGAQLHRLEHERPGVLSGDARIVPWPQYWAWNFCGIAASEVSSLGCHTDLWCPGEARPSQLARSRGWDARLAPLHRAKEVLGSLRPEWASRTGLSQDVRVYCGIHDSNAALLAARGFCEIAEQEATVIATGTWFVAMRMPGKSAAVDLAALPQSRDCLVNVDVNGRPLPSARFMGGRELDVLGGRDRPDAAAVMRALPAVVESGCMVLPSWVEGVGPYPRARGRWLEEPDDAAARCAAVGLYAALMTDASLELIGARERLVLEGRFGFSDIFVRALAVLRPDADVLVNRSGEGGVPYGALRLVDPSLSPAAALERVPPLETNLAEYKARWRDTVSVEDGRA